MEKHALHESLRMFFPTHKNGQEVVWENPQFSNSATSRRLIANAVLSTPMHDLAEAMFGAAIDGKKGPPSDLVIVIDDVELGNVGQETIVATQFREALSKRLLEYSANTQTRYRAVLREKCSFHMLKPMVESYLFGDPPALASAGVPASRPPKLLQPRIEQFESNDILWLPTCAIENSRLKTKLPWWRHECHPKHYLVHLAASANVFYEETNHGKHALKSLNWNTAALAAPKDVPIIRSLFQDLADWFGVPNPLGTVEPPDYNFYPAPNINRSQLLLRNM